MSSTSTTDERVNHIAIDVNDINQCKVAAETMNDEDANILQRLTNIQTDTECLMKIIKPLIGFGYPSFVISYSVKTDAVTNTDVINADGF